MQPIGALGQVWPDDGTIEGLAFRNNLKTRNDFPAQRERGSLGQFGPRGLAGTDHNRVVKKPAR
jgi:hypothetical protein